MYGISRRFIVALLLACLIILSGCQKSEPGSEFVGKWVNVKNGNRMEITRNGEQFLISAGGGTADATFKDGRLEIVHPYGTTVINYLKDSDRLSLNTINGIEEWEREK